MTQLRKQSEQSASRTVDGRGLSDSESFLKNESGLAMTEFALILPFLITIYFGFFALIETQDVSTRVGKVSAAVADIVAQSPAVTPQQIDAAMNAATSLMGTEVPGLNNRASELEISVFGIRVDSNENAIVEWSRGRNTTDLPVNGSSYPLPLELKLVEGFIVASRTKYKFKPPFGSLFMEEIDMDYENYFIPRISSETECPTC